MDEKALLHRRRAFPKLSDASHRVITLTGFEIGEPIKPATRDPHHATRNPNL
jgi:hypothetical protein